MPGRSYADFDLRVERSGDGFHTWADSSLTGEANAPLRLPPEIAGFTSRRIRSHRGRDLRRPSKKTDLRSFGRQLFRALFCEGVEICLRESLVQAAAQNVGLRLRLRLNGAPELARLPWEYLCDPNGDFLALSENTPIVRYPELALRRSPLAAAPPLRVLVLIASPPGLPPLSGDEEMRQIEKALAGLVGRGLVVLERVEPPTFPELLVRLRRERCPIFHFIGHGAFEPERGEGTLAFEDGQGRVARIDGQDLGAVLHRRNVSLVVLNTCEGARHDESDALAGVAQALIRRDVPAVVAMQSVVSDSAAVTFAQHFYQNLAEGLPVDGGLSEARLAMLTEGHTTEWGTPVLYMRAPDGHLFAAPGEPLPGRWQRWRGGLAYLRSPRVWVPIALLLTGGYALSQFVMKAAPPAPRPVPARRAEPQAAPPPLTRSAFVDPVQPSPPAPTPKAASRKPAAREKSVPGCPSPPGTDIRFVRIEKGTFQMGSDRKGEGPAHEVTLSHAFCIGQFEVTKAQWRQVEQPAGARQPDDRLPMTKVSYFEVHHFIDKLNERAGKMRYRLPYEAEWEYAIRAQWPTSYSFGDAAADLYRYGNCQSTAEHSDGFEKLAPVGSFAANPWGLFDVHGNVWEWVEDWYSPTYPLGAAIDPTGPANGEKRVRRGGSFKSSAANCRSTARSGWSPGKGENDLGFRLVQILE